MESSTTFALSIILHDAVKELKIIANVVDLMQKRKRKNDISHSEAEEFVVKQMKKILDKYSFKYSASLHDIRVEMLKELQKTSKISEYPSVATNIEDSFLSTKYTEKLLKETFCLIDILEKLAEEIQATGSCDTLKQSVDMEELEFEEIERILERERKAREKIKEMKLKIQEKNEERVKIVEQGKENIASLKDHVQEMKAKIIMEEKYITRYSTVKLEEFQSQCDQKEDKIKGQMNFIQSNRSIEERVHAEFTSYLNDRISYLKKHEEYWQEKSDKDIMQFKQELNQLKDKKERNLNKLKELSSLYKEYEAVVLSDRIEKEKARQREEQAELELHAACKIQNWWRTICVQHNLGPYGKKKRKGKGSKGKKEKGKKK
ncbi:Dynein regulatory complex protein 9 [Schistosoma japonicum]|nr:Dynein regulatory complex protein 9 [Schistosoma japonicum]